MNSSNYLILLVLFTLMLTGCATVHPGSVAKPKFDNKKLPLVVSAESVSDRGESFELLYPSKVDLLN